MTLFFWIPYSHSLLHYPKSSNLLLFRKPQNISYKDRSTLIPFQFTWSILKPAPKFCHKITISHSIASREHAPFTGLVKQARSWKHSIVVEVSDVKSSMNAAIETISRLQIKTASFEYMVTVIPVPKIDFFIM